MIKKDNNYFLAVGEKDSLRLDIVEKIYGKSSRLLFSEIGLHMGMNVLDVGCGNGNVSCWLAKKIGPYGRVIAVDSSIEQLKIAEKKAHEQQIYNIDFSLMRGEELDQIKDSFDIVYCRFFLFHIKQPSFVLKKMYLRVKVGGCLICEEPSINTAFCYPNNNSYSLVRSKFVDLCKEEGLDPDVGLKLKEMFASIGCKENIVQFSQPVLNSSNERIFEHLALTNLADKYIAKNLLNSAEIDQLLHELKMMADNDKLIISPARVTQIYAQKSHQT